MAFKVVKPAASWPERLTLFRALKDITSTPGGKTTHLVSSGKSTGIDIARRD